MSSFSSVKEPQALTRNAVERSDITRSNSKYNYEPASIWSNIMYGLGMVAYIALPPMIPGVSMYGLILFNVGLLVLIYFIALLAQSVRVLMLKRNRS